MLAWVGAAMGATYEDSAANYSGGSWTNGSNGGAGFKVWSIAAWGDTGWAGCGIWNSTNAGLGMGEAFGCVGKVGYINIDRYFLQPLNVGDSLALDFGVNWDAGIGNKGFSLYANGAEVINVNNAGSQAITVNGNVALAEYGTNTMRWTFTQVAANRIAVHATGRNNGAETFSTTVTTANAYGYLGSLRFYSSGLAADAPETSQGYFDHLTLVQEGTPPPAPASASFAAWIVLHPELTGTNALPEADPDGDTLSNETEFRVDTDPALATVPFGFTRIGADGRSMQVPKDGTNARSYLVQFAGSTLINGDFAWGHNTVVDSTNGQMDMALPEDLGDAVLCRLAVAGMQPPVPPDRVYIPAGNFDMGDAIDNGARSTNELPVHTVYVSAFYMEKYEVTKGLYGEVYQWATNHGYVFDNEFPLHLESESFRPDNHPVYSLNWFDCVKWCNARSEREGRLPCYYLDGAVFRTGTNDSVVCDWSLPAYRLPTEAEWEKAARGGVSGRRYAWSDSDEIQHARANYRSNYDIPYDTSPTSGYHPAYYPAIWHYYTAPVGRFAPNGYGLYDMSGNVDEWCWDWWGEGWYSDVGATTPDTRGPASGLARIVRGGHFADPAWSSRVAARFADTPGFSGNGFRTAMSAE